MLEPACWNWVPAAWLQVRWVAASIYGLIATPAIGYAFGLRAADFVDLWHWLREGKAAPTKAKAKASPRKAETTAISVQLRRPDVLATQFRAILRVAAAYPVKAMLPMVATLAEILAAREVLAEARAATGITAVATATSMSVATRPARICRFIRMRATWSGCCA